MFYIHSYLSEKSLRGLEWDSLFISVIKKFNFSLLIRMGIQPCIHRLSFGLKKYMLTLLILLIQVYKLSFSRSEKLYKLWGIFRTYSNSKTIPLFYISFDAFFYIKCNLTIYFCRTFQELLYIIFSLNSTLLSN